MKTDKNELRKAILKERSGLSQEECQILSENVCKRLTELDLYKKSDTVFAYAAIRNEVCCGALIEKAMNDGKKVALPKVLSSDGSNEMQFFYIDGESALASGFMGIWEPEENYSNLAIPSVKTLIILPGIAFDRNFARIGYGKGFYDRYLSLYRENSQSIAVCYDFQLFDKIPSDEHDIPADAVVTPTQTLLRRMLL